MTLDEIRRTDKLFLTPDDISEVLGSDKHTIIVSARNQPELTRYPFTFIGTRMKIPRIGFLNWYTGGYGTT